MNSVLSAKSGCQISFYAHTLMGLQLSHRYKSGFLWLLRMEVGNCLKGYRNRALCFPNILDRMKRVPAKEMTCVHQDFTDQCCCMRKCNTPGLAYATPQLLDCSLSLILIVNVSQHDVIWFKQPMQQCTSNSTWS